MKHIVALDVIKILIGIGLLILLFLSNLYYLKIAEGVETIADAYRSADGAELYYEELP